MVCFQYPKRSTKKQTNKQARNQRAYSMNYYVFARFYSVAGPICPSAGPVCGLASGPICFIKNELIS
jgi:hypothetical protein